jgi:hypothetical protein
MQALAWAAWAAWGGEKLGNRAKLYIDLSNAYDYVGSSLEDGQVLNELKICNGSQILFRIGGKINWRKG